jgi:tripartite-type tricarboxylate transporter receptor subunit TctC
MKKLRKLLVLFIATCTVLPAALAQTYPSRPIRVIVPFPPGGPSDSLTRLVAQQMGKQMGQTFFVENKPGAGGTVGNAELAKAPADGYTLLHTSAPFVISQYVYPSLPYDGKKDFTPIGLYQTTPLVLVVNPDTKIGSIGEYLRIAKAKPGEITFGSSGNGSLIHLTGELVKMQAGINLTHVPYKGGGPALQDLLAGHIKSSFMSPTEVNPYLASGKLVALATTSSKRMSGYDVPTLSESGLPGFETVAWFGFMVRSGTPPDVMATLSANLQIALRNPEVREKLARTGDVPAGTTSEFSELLGREHARWSGAVRAADAKPD